MITLTGDAAEVVRGLLADQDLPAGTALRVDLTNEGCEGSRTKFRYALGFDPEPARPDDHLYESEGIRIVASRESLPHLDGLRLAVRRKFGGVELTFQNPRATHSCGCGHTFSDEEVNPEETEASTNR